jgi:Zn-dependent oligopeptidase
MVLYEELLRHGGAKDPMVMLQNVLGRAPSMESFLRELGVDSRRYREEGGEETKFV